MAVLSIFHRYLRKLRDVGLFHLDTESGSARSVNVSIFDFKVMLHVVVKKLTQLALNPSYPRHAALICAEHKVGQCPYHRVETVGRFFCIGRICAKLILKRGEHPAMMDAPLLV